MNELNYYYLAGLVSTDGYIDYPESTTKRKGYYCCIGLSSKDEKILYDIQKVFNGKITKRNIKNGTFKKNYSITTWSTSNKELIISLRNIGLTNNKTYNLNVTDWFNSLTYEQKCTYIRGCWDGDGTINFNKTTKNKNLYMSVTSICSASLTFVKMIECFFEAKGKLYTRKTEANSMATVPLFYYYLNSKSALLLEQVYKFINTTDNCLYLQRKYDNYLKIKEYYNNIHKPRYTFSLLHGPRWNCNIKKWGSSIITNSKRYNLGIYKHEKNAAIAYDIAKFVTNNTKLKYNFPSLLVEYQKLNIDHNKLTYTDMPIIVQTISECINEEIKKSASQYRGLYKIKNINRWTVTVYHNGIATVHNKTFKSEIKAALKYDHLAFKLKGQKAKLNFPERVSKYVRM